MPRQSVPVPADNTHTGAELASIQLVDAIDLTAMLFRACKSAGSQQAFGRQIGASRQFVHQVINGDKPASPAMLAALGVRRVERFQIIGEQK